MLHYKTYFKSNSRPWVTLIHGAGGSSSIWYPQIRDLSNEFNVLLIDLRGHGKSKSKLLDSLSTTYTFEVISEDILEVLDQLKIKRSHFIGVSLGTILIRQISESHPHRIISMILSGAIVKLNFKSRALMRFGNLCKSIVPYIWLYRLFAYIIMPKKNHKTSRLLFVREAKKLAQKEFIRWFRLTTELKPLLKMFRQIEVKIPTLYLMGSEDYMFLPSIKKIVERHQKSQLEIIPNCGHVVNIEQPQQFNLKSLNFLKNQLQ